MKKSFILYQDYLEHINFLSDEQAGKLFKAIFLYNQGHDVEMEPIVRMAFSFIKVNLDRDMEKYESVKERNKINGLKGGRPVKTEEPNETQNNPVGLSGLESVNLETQNNPKKPDTDTDTDTDTGIDSERVKKKNLKKKKTESAESAESAAAMCVPEYIPEALLLDFYEHRISLKKPMTDRAKELLISKIINLYNDGNDPARLLEEAIMRGWQTVYATNESKGRKNNAENWNSGYSTNGAEYQPFGGHQQDTGYAPKLSEYERKIITVRRNLGLGT
jgi:hypothetical protein